MKMGVVIGTNDAESAWSALRFANTLLNAKHSVKVFLISKGVEIDRSRIINSTYKNGWTCLRKKGAIYWHAAPA